MAAPTQLPLTVGLLSGISYVSGIDYYKSINERYGTLVPRGQYMPKNPPITMHSIECDNYAACLVGKDWTGAIKLLADGADKLVNAVDFLGICSNTGHLAVPEITRRNPGVQILHIADCTAMAIKKHPGNITCVGLLGTEPTMREPYLKDQLVKHGITTVVPDSDSVLTGIFNFIMNELGQDVFLDSTREYFLDAMRALKARGAQGCILGCTEIELLGLEGHIEDFPVFRSAQLHCDTIAAVQAGVTTLDDVAPSNTNRT